jgi:hypothetical protein
MTLARMRAKKSVLLSLRAQGLKPQHFSAREIAVLTDYCVNQHRAKLMAEAAEAIATWPGLAQWRCAELETGAQSESEPKSITSAEQNSSAEWSAKQRSLLRQSIDGRPNGRRSQSAELPMGLRAQD